MDRGFVLEHNREYISPVIPTNDYCFVIGEICIRYEGPVRPISSFLLFFNPFLVDEVGYTFRNPVCPDGLGHLAIDEVPYLRLKPMEPIECPNGTSQTFLILISPQDGGWIVFSYYWWRGVEYACNRDGLLKRIGREHSQTRIKALGFIE